MTKKFKIGLIGLAALALAGTANSGLSVESETIPKLPYYLDLTKEGCVVHEGGKEYWTRENGGWKPTIDGIKQDGLLKDELIEPYIKMLIKEGVEHNCIKRGYYST